LLLARRGDKAGRWPALADGHLKRTEGQGSVTATGVSAKIVDNIAENPAEKLAGTLRN